MSLSAQPAGDCRSCRKSARAARLLHRKVAALKLLLLLLSLLHDYSYTIINRITSITINTDIISVYDAVAVCICGNQLLTQILTHFYVLLGLRKKSSREISHLHRNVGGAGKALG